MNILIMGMGYVGVTTALVFAEMGHAVTGLDIDRRKLELFMQGVMPFHEPGLNELLTKHVAQGTMTFTADPKSAVERNQLIFICVGTPSLPSGGANLAYLRDASITIGTCMQNETCVVIKSTVPVGTHEKVVRWIRDALPAPVPYYVASNPEFLREGSALADSWQPDRIVIGSDHESSAQLLTTLYEPIHCPVLITKPKTAEMIKYASNAFLAAKISFVNELARLCDELELNINDVMQGVGMDHRIGPYFLRAGIGYGGSCFPKDVNALLSAGREYDIPLTILEQVERVNQSQPVYYLRKLEKKMISFRGKTIAVLGLAFKPDTDDTREAPAMRIIAELLGKHAAVNVHDPYAKLPPSLVSSRVQQCRTLAEALSQAHAAILCTEWEEYLNADWESLRKAMRGYHLLDGRNVLDKERMNALGYHYMGVSYH